MEQQIPIPPPPQIKDEAKTRHFPILDLWGRGVQFPIYFVQDCSYFDFFTYFPISSQGSPASLRATPLVVRRGCRSSRYALKCKSTTDLSSPPAQLSRESASLLSGSSRVQTPAGATLRRRLHAGKHSGSLYN